MDIDNEVQLHMASNFVGVIGGLGPAATSVYLDMLVRATVAHKDQDHIDAVVLQHSSIPDRTAHILDPENAPDPTPYIERDAQFLLRAGASCIVLPCNTAHVYSQHIEECIGKERFLSIVSLTADYADYALQRSNRSAMILATEGNIDAGIYQNELRSKGIEPIVPDKKHQAIVNILIYEQVKAGFDGDLDLFEQLIAYSHESGAGAVLLACTELSVMFDRYRLRKKSYTPVVIDSLTELVKATVKTMGKELTNEFSQDGNAA